MKKDVLKSFPALAFCLLGFLSSCGLVDCTKGSGNPATQHRTVKDFTKITIAGAYRITLKQDSSLNISITGDDNLLQFVKTDVSDGELFIKMDKVVCPNNQMKLTIGVHNLKAIESSGALELYSDGLLNVQDFKLDLSGETRTALILDAANLTTTVSGDADITLKGQADTHVLNISGSERVKAFGFVVSDYDIQSSGNDECEINVLHSLDLHTSGSSDVKYKGAPIRLVNEKSGSSMLEKVN